MDLGIGVLLDKLIKHREKKRRQPEILVPVHGADSAPSTIPWEAWELDKKFFRALSLWTLDHPQTSLDRVLENICVGIDRSQDLIGLIPEHPFPARSLIMAVVHLFKLGVAISRTAFEVQAFAKNIIHWVIGVKSVFDSTPGGEFSRTAWRNLAKMRELIDEICTWAVKRLEDKRWLQIGRGMTVQKEISEFKTRITEAREIFSDISVLNLLKGIDAIKQDLQELFRRQESIIMLEIKKIRICQANQLAYIMSDIENRKDADVRRKFLSETLIPYTVENPTYTHQGKQPCDINTRVEVLADINGWISDMSPTSRNFLWLTGDPGCGKSAITASIARACKDERTLWAQFFINRNNDNTTKPNSYFPSIARQLADRSSAVQHAVYDALVEKPSLMDNISIEQATKLFIDAIGVACSLDQSSPLVIVVDGLDETDRSRLKETATVFSQLFEALRKYPNAKVFISSRTEDDIRSPFARTINDVRVKHIHLDTSAPSSIDDVAAFLKRQVFRIVEDNDLNWEVWPGDERLRTLTVRASGLFIWAVTVTKFLQEQIDTLGTECLDTVLDLLNAEGMGDINTLYNIILRLTHTKSSEWEFEKFRRIVGAIVVLREPLSLAGLGGLLNLRNPTTNAPVDIGNFVRRLRTVLVAGTNAISDQTVPRLHKSFFEFIISEHVDSSFRIRQESADAELGCQCLWHLGGMDTDAPDRILSTCNQSNDKRNTLSVKSLTVPFRYSTLYWTLHLPRLVAHGTVVMDDSFSPDEVQSLLKRSTNNCHLGPASIIVKPGQSSIETSVGDETRKWDAMTGAENREITVLRDHGGGVGSVAFSPDGMQIVSGSVDKTVRLWNATTGATVHIFLGHTEAVCSVAFSPNGNQIASGSFDGTIRLWSTTTGKALHKPLTTGTGRIFSVAFSPSGKYLVSGSSNGALNLWDVRTGLLRKWGSSGEEAQVSARQNNILSVAFSPDGTKIATASTTSVCVRSMSTAQIITGTFSHFGIACVAFSPDGSQIVSSSFDNALFVWNIISKKKVFISATHDIGDVLSVAFSPDGKYIVSGGMDKKIHLWSALDGSPVDILLNVHTGYIWSVSFSPDGKYLASASRDGTVCIQDLPVRTSPRQSNSHILSASFSPNGKQTALVAENNAIYIYEAGIYRHLESDGHPTTHSDSKVIYPAIRSLCFSSDSAHIAAALDNGALQLWNLASCQLLASFPQGSVTQAMVSVSLIVSHRSIAQSLVISFVDGTARVWEASHGVFKPVYTSSQSPPQDALFLELGPEKWGLGSDFVANSRLRTMRYYTRLPEGGLWAFVNNRIIRGNVDGSLTILPVTHASTTSPHHYEAETLGELAHAPQDINGVHITISRQTL